MSARPIGKPARLIPPTRKSPARLITGFALQDVLLGLLALICRPRGNLRLDAFSDHMLRDIGIDRDSRENSSGIGFWR